MIKAEHIRERAQEHLKLISEDKTFGITITIGIASYPYNTKTRSGLLELADQALYQAKERGRNRVVLSEIAVI